MVEPVHVFWCLVALLALAAACNHGWHHTRAGHLATHLARVSYRTDTTAHVPAPPSTPLDRER